MVKFKNYAPCTHGNKLMKTQIPSNLVHLFCSAEFHQEFLTKSKCANSDCLRGFRIDTSPDQEL